ncbi:MAG TPA: GNAT family N-acetyltransferase [Hyphomicrobiaceae bacterium]|nr:GNAT family N-acetyltransferase [Hyphomicrobiaceae bacterium]
MSSAPGLSGSPNAVTIARLREAPDSGSASEAIEAIFFESSGRRFDNEASRAEFLERWLGRYLTHYPEYVFVALAPGGEFVGYLVGCLDDPASNPLFSDISYFAEFAHLTRKYPAHLHINLTARWRGQGIGKRLVATFAECAAKVGVPGLHVITAEGHRNNRFYVACGFVQLGSAVWNGNRIAFFGRALVRSDDCSRDPDLPRCDPLG